jgi:hypothetical protein
VPPPLSTFARRSAARTRLTAPPPQPRQRLRTAGLRAITIADVTLGNKLVIEALAARNPVCNSLSVRRCCARGRRESLLGSATNDSAGSAARGSDQQIMPPLPRGSLQLQVCRPGPRGLGGSLLDGPCRQRSRDELRRDAHGHLPPDQIARCTRPGRGTVWAHDASRGGTSAVTARSARDSWGSSKLPQSAVTASAGGQDLCRAGQ